MGQGFSDDKLQSLVDVVYDKVLAQIRLELNDSNVEFCCTGVVKSVDTTNNKATVDVGFCTTELIKNLTNKTLTTTNTTNETLTTGDTVKIFYDKYDMRNAYIGLKIN